MAPFIIKVAMCPHAHRDYPHLRSSVLVDLNRAYRSGSLDEVRDHVFADWNRQFPAVPLDEGSIQFHRRSAPCNRTLGFADIKANHGFADDGEEVNPAKVLMMHVTGKEGRRPYRLPAGGQHVQSGQSRKIGRNGQRQGATGRQQRHEQDDVEDEEDEEEEEEEDEEEDEEEEEEEDEEQVPKRRGAGQSRGRGGVGAPPTQDDDDEEDEDEDNENDADERYSASTDDSDTGNFDASPALEEDDEYREDGDERKFVRVGRIPEQDDEADENDPNDNRVTMRVIVVAVVERIAGRPPRRGRDAVPPYDQITYKGVETWRINSRRVGDYPSADDYNSCKDIPGFVMDSFWKRLWQDQGLSLDEKVRRYLKSKSKPLVLPDYLDFKGDVRQRSPLTRSRPIKAPCKPKHFPGPANTFFTTYSGIHEKTDEKGGRGDIHAVIAFRNTSEEVGDLRLATNVQATLEWKESLESFRKYIKTELFPETEESCLWQRLRNKSFTHWTDLEIWVLPQWRRDRGAKRPKELVRWDTKGTPGWHACDFLDQKGIRTYGRQLYFEVRIVCDKRANEKDQIWKRSGYEKGRTRKYGFIHKGVKDVSLLDDVDDDRQGHVARNLAPTQTAPGTGAAGPSAGQGAPARSGPASHAGGKRTAQSTAGPPKKKQKTSKK